MRSVARKFQDLIVWQKAHALVLDIYQLTRAFPLEERYGLTSQIRRSAFSVPANIAEGFRRAGRTDKARFMNIAQGSLEEVRYYLILIKDLEYVDCNQMLMRKLEEVSKLLDGYYKGILRSPYPTTGRCYH